MSNIQAFILGLVQGLAEFLPISSSGHLTLLQMFFGINEAPLALDVLLHFGTLIAVLIVYWKRIVNMILHPLKSELKWLIVATIPAVIAALLLNDLIDAAFKGEYLGYCFLLTSFVLLLGESINRFPLKSTSTLHGTTRSSWAARRPSPSRPVCPARAAPSRPAWPAD